MPPATLDKRDNGLHVQFRKMLENVVAALGKYGQFSFGKTAKKSNALLYLEKMTSIRVHYQGRA